MAVTEQAPEGRTAVLWIGDLAAEDAQRDAAATAERMAVALTNQAPAAASFTVEPTGRGAGGVPTCTISQTDAAGTRAIIDVYGLPVQEALVGPVTAMPAWKQALMGAGSVMRVAGLIAGRLHQRQAPTSQRERMQLAFALGYLLLMVAGVVLLLGLVVAEAVAEDLEWLPEDTGYAIGAIGAFGIWRSGAAKRVREGALKMYAVHRYIDRADDSGAKFRGEIARMLDAIATADGGVVYERTVVMAYSFGSLVALDTCFSPTAQPPARIGAIDDLVTIACPYDLVRTFQPDYAGARDWRDNAPRRWLNVYAPADVLSSNFRDDAKPLEPTVRLVLRGHPDGGRLPENLAYRVDGRDEPCGVRDSLAMRGLSLHGRYWSEDSPHAESVFAPLVERVFPETTGLAFAAVVGANGAAVAPPVNAG